ncbi:MAG: hypothetical protein UT69_C0012G0005 [Candidatus Yanofskybacteria bacterium GW2011_GWE1_40_10]|nr:MAG: hypothetical protein UT69_C0012G0005 [Candidatus Yanofskybacteria bacterium GW2011_GWE1_40_10]
MVNYFLVAVVVAVITFIVMRKLTPPPPAPKPVPVKTFGLAQAAKAAPMFQQLGDQAGLGAKIAMGVLAMMEIQSRVGADLKALLTERDNQIVAAGERSKAAQNEILECQSDRCCSRAREGPGHGGRRSVRRVADRPAGHRGLTHKRVCQASSNLSPINEELICGFFCIIILGLINTHIWLNLKKTTQLFLTSYL